MKEIELEEKREKETTLPFYPVIHMRNIQASWKQEPDALSQSQIVVKKERNVVLPG